MIENQVITIWRPPDKPPKEEGTYIVTVSGKKGKHITYDHALALASWYDDGEGWQLEDIELTGLVIHAWCDLEPYKG